MWSLIKHYGWMGYSKAITTIENLDRPTWLVILVVVTVAGFLVLQGFGNKRRI